MPLSDLLGETLETTDSDCWDHERTATPVRAFAVQLHSAGLSLRETVAVLDLLGVDRSHGAVWDWTHRLVDNQDDPPRSAPWRVILIICEAVRPVPDRSVRAVHAEEIENRHGLAQRESRRMKLDGERPKASPSALGPNSQYLPPLTSHRAGR